MLIFAVDDEKIALEGLMAAITKAVPAARVQGFQRAEKVLESCRKQEPDVVFADIEMRDMNGVELARQIKALWPRANIVFTTGYTEYTFKALEMHASGYILKPVTAEKIRREIAELRYPVEEKRTGLFLRAFGNFEVWYNGVPVKFHYSKTKELLAYLVDRNGALTTNNELEAALWEDEAPKSHLSYLKNLRADLLAVLDSLGCGGIVVKNRGSLAVIPEKTPCDYFEFLRAREAGEPCSLYNGEYMTQYSWAEMTHGSLEMM